MSPVRATVLPQKLAYRIDEAASALGLSRSRIYELIRDGELELGKLAGRSVIPREAVEGYRALPTKKPERVPAAPMCGVYLLVLAGTIVYVGRSTTLAVRLQTHRRSGRAFDESRVIACDLETSIWLERELIRTLNPETNLLRYKRHQAAVTRKQRRLA